MVAFPVISVHPTNLQKPPLNLSQQVAPNSTEPCAQALEISSGQAVGCQILRLCVWANDQRDIQVYVPQKPEGLCVCVCKVKS